MTPRAILPGATLGVMGGGQLGRMFVHAAQQMGYFTAVLDADPDVGLTFSWSAYLDETGARSGQYLLSRCRAPSALSAA